MPELTAPAAETGMPTPPAPTVPAPEWGDEVQRFAATHGLTDYIPAAVRIVEETFPPGTVVRYRIQYSPEDGSGRLVLDTLVPCSAKEASARFEKLLDRWTVEVPLHVRLNATVSICPV